MSKLTLYHNTSNTNAINISKEGIKAGMRLNVYGKGSEAEGSGIWCSIVRGYGYGGATITFKIDDTDKDLWKANDTEYIVYRDIDVTDIIDIDLMISDIPCNPNRLDRTNSTVESDIPLAIQKWGRDNLIDIFEKNSNHFVQPYNLEQLVHLIDTGEKYCRIKSNINEDRKFTPTKLIDTSKLPSFEYEIEARSDSDDYKNIYKKYKNSKSKKIRCNWYELDCISAMYNNEYYEEEFPNVSKLLYESKSKIEEVSRNELLTRAKQQTITRYNKSVGYKGFSIVDIDTTSVFTTNCFRVTCGVGKYYDTVEMENILYWVQIEAEKDKSRQINSKGVTAAIMNSIDGMDIRIDCSCPDFAYRFAYRATKYKYKYGKPETRPAEITNPNEYGALCKHLISMLSNKKWLQQSTSILLDYLIERIDDVNKFLKLSGEDALTVPNELARQNARKATYSKLFKDVDNDDELDNEEIDSEVDNSREDNNIPEKNVTVNKPQGASIKSDRNMDINEEELGDEE